jgi:microcystin-dependent protein
MASPFLAQITLFAGNFFPRGWAFCDGNVLAIAQNQALFALLGTTYGGNGQTTFALPDLRGRAAMHPGNGPGLTPRVLGESNGEESHTLILSEMPAHNHPIATTTTDGNSQTPAGTLLAKDTLGGTTGFSTAAPNTNMAPASIAVAGGGVPHNNLPPYLCLNYIIALQGIFPSRN